MKRLEDYSDEEIANINLEPLNMNETIIPSSINDCDNKKICVPGEFFECVEKCKLCGKLQ